MNKLTIVITNFGRPDHLRRSLDSALPADARIVVVSTAPDNRVMSIIEDARRRRPDIVHVIQRQDHGNNEQWLLGVYTADTPYVQLLHDDDFLTSLYPQALKEEILPALGAGAERVVWDAQSFVTEPRRYHKQLPWPTTGIYKEVLQLRFGYTCLSPVSQIFRRDLSIEVLKECQKRFDGTYFTRPKMMVGNDLLLGLRHCAKYPDTLYVPKPLNYYQVWAGSETESHRKSAFKPLIEIYDRTRRYFQEHAEPDSHPTPRIVHVVNTYTASGENARRMAVAAESWQRLYDEGIWVPCHIANGDLSRSSKTVIPDDPRDIPFLKDLLDHGVGLAMPEDVIVYSNADIGIVPSATEKILASVQEHGCTFSFRCDTRWLGNRPERIESPLSTTDGLLSYVGADLFAFTPAWWSANRNLVQDWVIGNPTWDWGLRIIMELSAGTSVEQVRAMPVPQHGRRLEIPAISWHEIHDAPWTYRRDNPSTRWNHRVSRRWLTKVFGPPAGWPTDWRNECLR